MEEVWKDISGYEGLYQVSNLGRVKSLKQWNGHKTIDKEHILKCYFKENKGYVSKIVSLSKNGERKEYRVHRLVAEAFIENKDNKPFINHIDGNSTNNIVTNLEWCTPKENVVHYYQYLRKVDYDERKVVETYKNGMTPKDILDKYGVSNAVLYRLLKKYGVKPHGTGYYKNKYSINLEELLKDMKEIKSNKILAEKYGCNTTLIARRRYQMKTGRI